MAEPSEFCSELSRRLLTSFACAGADELRDIGSLAHWAVSSAKPGYGVEHVRDADPATLWQCVLLQLPNSRRALTLAVPGCRSEGAQPHLINIQFPKKQSITVRPPTRCPDSHDLTDPVRIHTASLDLCRHQPRRLVHSSQDLDSRGNAPR